MQPPLSLATLSPLPPSCYSSPSLCPSETTGWAQVPPPLASRLWQRGRSRQRVPPVTSPDRRLPIGPRSEPCRNCWASCFQTIPQEAQACKERSVLCFPGSLAGRVPSAENTVFIKSNAVTFQTRGQRQALGWWGVGGLPQSRSGPPITGSKGPSGHQTGLATGHWLHPTWQGHMQCQPLSPSPPEPCCLWPGGSLRWCQAWRGSRRAAGRGGGLIAAQPPISGQRGRQAGWASCRALAEELALQRVGVSTEPRGTACAACGTRPSPRPRPPQL